MIKKAAPVLWGGIGQIAASVGNSFMAPWGGIAGLGVTGYLTGNETLMTLAGMHLAAQVPLPGITQSTQAASGTNWL